MSLQQFQQALSSMTNHPALAKKVRRTGALALQGYDLTPFEQFRLISVANQPGMALNCTLARGNRFRLIFDVLPLVCNLLKPLLRELLDEFWTSYQPNNYQLSGETEAFASFLKEKLGKGLAQPYLEEILNYEIALFELAQSLRYNSSNYTFTSTTFREIGFQHNPRMLLPPLQSGELPCANLPSGNYLVSVMLCNGSLVVELK